MKPSCCPRHLEAETERLFVARDSVSGDRFEIVTCVQCGLARTDPQPAPDELGRYYPSGYHGVTKRYRLRLDRSLSVLHRARIRRIERLAGGPGRVVDIGCGPGWFLESMRRRGWQTRGTERSTDSARLARDALDLDVRAQELDELVAEGVSYDAVVLWHVAEHLHDPVATLRQIASLLRPGGVVMVAVPNFGSPESRIGGAGWFHLDVPRHLFHFTADTLRQMVADAGLEPHKEVHIAPEYDLFSFVQTAQNRIGLPPNLLYDLLRRREARLGHVDLRWSLSVVALATAVPLTIAAIIWAPLAAVLGRSATITIYAHRPMTVSSDGGELIAGRVMDASPPGEPLSHTTSGPSESTPR